MSRICVYTVWNGQDEPLISGIKKGDIVKICRFFIPGLGTTVGQIEDNKTIFNKIISRALTDNVPVVTSDFKQHLVYFDLPIVQGVNYSAYDICCPCRCKNIDVEKLELLVVNGLNLLSATKLYQWHRLFANAAVVYRSMEINGVLTGGLKQDMTWSQQTFSGRSKNRGFNLQGAIPDEIELRNSTGPLDDVFVHFDWIAADVNAAAHISKDELLLESFKHSDPYSVMENLLASDDGEVNIDRDQCKLLLLTAINKLDIDSPVVADIFPDLGKWLFSAKLKLNAGNGLRTLLGRVFKTEISRSELAVLNGVFQGSVAHAMHSSLKKIWDLYGGRLLADMHDSVVVTCPNPNNGAEQFIAMVNTIASIMTRPFAGLLESNPFFPVKVSIGNEWRKWRPRYVFRESGVEVLNGAGQETPSEVEASAEEVTKTG